MNSTDLFDSVLSCRDRGLVYASKWSAQMLHSISTNSSSSPAVSLATSPRKYSPDLLLAQVFHSTGEYARAADVLKNSTSADPVAVFLQHYSLLLALSLRTEEQMSPTFSTTITPSHALLISLHEKTSKLVSSSTPLASDPWILYLHALVESKLVQKDKAGIVDLLIRSIKQYPYNWSAWELLAKSCGMDEALFTRVLECIDEKNPILPFFILSLGVDKNAPPRGYDQALDQLLEAYPTSGIVKSLSAITSYNNRGTLFLNIPFDMYNRVSRS